jgi:hypothetical protein
MSWSTEPGDPSDAVLIWAEEARRADDAEVAERIEVESAVTPWSSLVCAAHGRAVEVVTEDGVTHRGLVKTSGERWVLITTEVDVRLLMLDRVVSIAGLGAAAAAPRVVLGPGSVLRRWSQTSESVFLQLADGSRVRGVVAGVYSDALDVRTDDEPPRRQLLPFGGVIWASVVGRLS